MKYVITFLAEPKTHLYPLVSPTKTLPTDSITFFIDKITKIHNDLIVKQQYLPPYVEIPAPPNTKNFCKFQPITLSNLQKIIWSTPNKNWWAWSNPNTAY